MCYSIFKWRKFVPSEEFLSKVSKIKTLSDLKKITKDFTYQSDPPGIFGDKWNTPEETLNSKIYDCDDIARFNSWILKHILKKEAYFGVFAGRNSRGYSAHAMAFFKEGNKWGVFDNKKLYYVEGDFEDIGRSYYERLRKYEILTPDGKIVKYRFIWS